MAKLIILLSLLAVSTTYAKPADSEALDKATANDVVINDVSPDSRAATNAETDKILTADAGNASSDVFHTSVSFATPTSNVVKPGVGVARIIDDIFQIPIGVLQSVARLLRNPFISHKTPETATSY